MKCPICKKHDLIAQSLEDSFGNVPDLYCPETITMPGGKIMNHHRDFQRIRQVRMIILPYKVTSENDYSKISIQRHMQRGIKAIISRHFLQSQQFILMVK